MKFLKAQILIGENKTDKIWLETDLPETFPSNKKRNLNLCFKFDCPEGEGEDYVKNNFPDIEIEIIIL